MQEIQILSMVNRELGRKGYSQAQIARKLNLSATTTYNMLRKNTMQVQRLAELSEVLDYNFFREIAAALPQTEPQNLQEDPSIVLKERIKELEMEVRILRETLKDISAR
jgi:transcriptional regulator with XRE-family HTH domain